MMNDFKETEEKTEKTNAQSPPQVYVRARMPRGKEVIGVITQRYGGNRMEVMGTDGKSRNCRVPGRYKRRLWLRQKDIVLIVPWPDNEKGDIIYKYGPEEANQLRKKGLIDLKNMDF